MTTESNYIEVQGSSVEEAIEKGLNQLGVSERDVDIEIIEQGSRGLFGIGSREAYVRLTLKGHLKQSENKDKTSSIPPSEKLTMEESAASLESLDTPDSSSPAKPVSKSPIPPKSTILEQEQAEEDNEYMLGIAHATISELLEKMNIEAKVKTRFDETNNKQYRRLTIIAEISGNDLTVLIGRRSETINALQYIARLIIGKELNRSVNLIIDIEGYRERRENQLRRLARRMAKQAVETGKVQRLEPMPANERRIIHIELREDPSVTTESVGEGNKRKVTILPKKQ